MGRNSNDSGGSRSGKRKPLASLLRPLFSFRFGGGRPLLAGGLFCSFGGFFGRFAGRLVGRLFAGRGPFAARENALPVVGILFGCSQTNDAHGGIVLLAMRFQW